MEKDIWEGRVKKETHKKTVGSCNRAEGRIYSEEGKSIFTVKRRERGGAGIHRGSAKKTVHQTVKVTPDVTNTLCSQEEWEEKNGTGLPTC